MAKIIKEATADRLKKEQDSIPRRQPTRIDNVELTSEPVKEKPTFSITLKHKRGS